MTDLKSNNEFDSLEAFFHERLKDASFAPAEESWKRIEAELELMDKQKRKRRFIWFFSSGLVLLSGLAALWFFALDEKFMARPVAQKNVVHAAAENKIAAKEITSNDQNKTTELAQNENAASKNKTDEINLQPAGEKNADVAQKTIEPASPLVISAAGSSQRIQLAACSKKANPAIFSKVPYKVIEVRGADGLIRYFADVAISEEALNTIQQAGFARAFVKKNYIGGYDAVTVKDEGVIENNSSAYVAANAAKTAPPDAISKANNGSVTTTPAINKSSANNSVPYAKNVPTGNTYTANPAIAGVIPNPDYKPEPPAAIVNNKAENNTGNSHNTSGNELPTSNTGAASQNAAPAGETKNSESTPQPAEVKTDSLPSTLAANENKTDSVPPKVEPADSTKKTVADIAPPFTPEWALLFLAGPNIFTSGAQSNLYSTSGESQPVTVNTALEVQFKPFRRFSFSGGVNYTQFSVRQATTQFYFNKHQTNDYIFYSAFGPMAVPMSTVMEGFSPLAPLDTLTCKYSQESKLNLLGIPLEMNFHFLNKSRISLFAGLGANSSFALSQQGTLTLHKENLENKVSYNSVTVNRFSMSLIFSLGCDVRIGKKIYITFVPSYRYGLSNLSATGGITFAPACFSGNAGLKFKF